MTGRSIQSRVVEVVDELPGSHRKVADLLLRDPESVAFGTLDSVAAAASTSSTTVLRFAARLGYDGFAALRDAVRDEVSEQLRSAVTRVRRPPQGPLLVRALAVERANLEDTFASFDDDKLDAAGELLADLDRHLWVLTSSQTTGIGSTLADNLQICRPGVTLLTGSEFRIMTMLTALGAGDVVITLDVQRHERWLVRVQRHAVARGARPIALTDRLPCSLDLTEGLAVVCGCATTTPFESQVGMVAAANVLVATVAERLRDSVALRVDALESTWVDEDLFDT
jgi:DNA-binding MurR/RpiR family transcriptional regulator